MSKRKHVDVGGLGALPQDGVAPAKPGSVEKRKKTRKKRPAEVEGFNMASGAAKDDELEVAQQIHSEEVPPARKLSDPPGQQQHQQQQATQDSLPGRSAGKPAPVLPWMRVPIAIEASEGILLEEVHGLDPRLKAGLEGAGSC